jgi:hypothetical protein
MLVQVPVCLLVLMRVRGPVRAQLRAVPPELEGTDPWAMYRNPALHTLTEEDDVELQWRPNTAVPYGWWKGTAHLPHTHPHTDRHTSTHRTTRAH